MAGWTGRWQCPTPRGALALVHRPAHPTHCALQASGDASRRAGRWEVRIGLRGSKHVYLGLHSSEVEAARVYDRALVLLTGPGAATNFPVASYAKELAAYQRCAPLGL